MFIRMASSLLMELLYSRSHRLHGIIGIDLQGETAGADDPLFTLLESGRTWLQTNSNSTDHMPTTGWRKFDAILKDSFHFRFICKELVNCATAE